MTIAGGKWTTYRRMAEDCVNRAATLGSLPERECVTRSLRLHGSDAGTVADPDRSARPHPALPYTEAQVVEAVRNEMARTVEDVLARRTRALLLNARAAMEMAPGVAAILAAELGCDTERQLEQFLTLAQGYLPGSRNGG